MREIQRIPRVMSLIEDIWKLDPDLRFMQLVDMIKGGYSRTRDNEGKVQCNSSEDGHLISSSHIDLFHLEDNQLEGYLYELLSELKPEKTEVDLFFDKMLDFFPGCYDEYRRSIRLHGKRLSTVIVEDIIMPEVLQLLRDGINGVMLTKLFAYFEEVSLSRDEELGKLFSVTVLESVGNSEAARRYMGPTTYKKQIKADENIGRYR